MLRLSGFLSNVWVWLVLLAPAGLLAPAPALAARGHVFGRVFGSPGSGPGQFLEPAGVAVNESQGEPASGDVYVVDKGNNRVERFTSAGVFEGEIAGPSASGSGALTEGSATIESVLIEAGAFSVGEEVSALGLPTGTTIVSVGEGTLEVSAPVKVGDSGLSVALSAHQSFAAPDGIAVDNSCALRGLAEPACHAEDPSGGDMYVDDTGHGLIDKFTATGVYLGQVAGLSTVTGIGVDTGGEVWVGQPSGSARFTDAQPNEPLPVVGATLPTCFNQAGFAVDSEDDLYSHSESGGGKFCGDVTKFSSEGAVLDGAFDAEGADWLAVELSSSDDVYVDHGGSVDRREPNGSLLESLGSEPGPGRLTAGTGVAVSAASESVYVAEPVASVVFEYLPEAPGPPTVSSEGVSKVTGDSATFEGEVNPRGASTSYHFEYGPCTTLSTCGTSGYGASVPVPDGVIGSGFDVQTLAPVNVQGLVAGTLYHYRIVASNEAGGSLYVTDGAERLFTTQVAGPLVLADDREWELVSPPDKHGALIEPTGKEAAIQASVGGGAMAFATGSPTESAPEGYAATVQVLAARGADGWSSRDLTLPHEVATRVPVGDGSEFRIFSEDLSRAMVQPQGNFIACRSAEGVAQPCLSSEATEQTAFLATSFLNRDPREPCIPATMACYKPLVTSAPGVANVPAGTQFGEEAECSGLEPKLVVCGPEFVDATPDLSHVLLRSSVALSSPAGANLYEWSAGRQLVPVSVLPEDEGDEPTGGFVGANGENARQAISGDGARVFWSTSGAGNNYVYVRDVEKGQTLRITSGEGEFQDASSDGSRVLYKESGSLYECVIEEELSKLKCATSELGSGVLGTSPGESEDGSWVYFVSGSVLAPGALSGEPNLYLRHGGVTSLIAVLAKADSPDWTGAQPNNLSHLTARVSPDGHWLAFMSERGLTGYDSRDAISGVPDEEVYLYDGETGSLVCASCDPSGARPVGEEGKQVSFGHSGFVGGEAWASSGGWLAANVPAWSPYRLVKALYQPRYLSDSGRLFFNARDSLVPQAANGTWDVYEYEPEGVGPAGAVCGPLIGANSGSEVFERERVVDVEGRMVAGGAGCVGLISGGGSGQESAFMDASENGSDVFFMTTAKLSAADIDVAYDVYDAHECTSVSPCLPTSATTPPACSNEASCLPAPTPQPEIFAAPASETFSGAGEVAPIPPVASAKAKTRAQLLAAALKVCAHKSRVKRKVCEASARKRYGRKSKPKPKARPGKVRK